MNKDKKQAIVTVLVAISIFGIGFCVGAIWEQSHYPDIEPSPLLSLIEDAHDVEAKCYSDFPYVNCTVNITLVDTSDGYILIR